MLKKLIQNILWIIFNKKIFEKVAYRLINIFEHVLIINDCHFDDSTFKMEIRSRKSLFHAKTSSSEESHTINWINSYFKENQIFYDVGANVGLYSLYAASKIRDINIFAFEPEALNFSQLNRNIHFNRFSHLITPYCIALTDQTHLGMMNLEQFRIGGTINQFNRSVNQINESFEVQHRQGSVGFTLDELIYKFGLPVPNHIKIDVDGIEDAIISGAVRTLNDKKLISVQIEITDVGERVNTIHKILLEAGLNLVSSTHHRSYTTIDFLFARDEKKFKNS